MRAKKKILKKPLRIALVLLLAGMVAKILEWQHAPQLMFFAFAVIGILYSVRFWNKADKEFLDYVKFVMIIFWACNGLLHILNYPYTVFFQVITAISFLIWFVMEGTAYFMDEERRSKNNMARVVWNFVLVFGVLAIIAGGLLYVLDWAFAIPLLILGIATVALYILKDIVAIKKSGNGESNNEEYQM